MGAAGKALVGCISAVVSSHECGPTALSKGLSSVVSPLASGTGLFLDFDNNPETHATGADLFGLAVKTVVGGYASVLGGSKFANGAESGAFQYLLAQQSPGPALNKDSEGISDILAPPSPPPAPKKPKPKKASSAPPPVVSSAATPTSAPATGFESDFEPSGPVVEDRIRGGLAIRGFEAQ